MVVSDLHVSLIELVIDGLKDSVALSALRFGPILFNQTDAKALVQSAVAQGELSLHLRLAVVEKVV